MSRIGKLPVAIPDKAAVTISGQAVTIKGPRGQLSMAVHPEIKATINGKEIVVERPSDLKKHRALHGLTRALLHNMVVGVTDGYVRELDIIGVGYRAELRGKTLIMYLGYSHPVVMNPPEGVSIEVIPKENKVRVIGIDKQLVGQVASKIRSFRKPEPYKGKGVRYTGEYVRTKAGKTAG